MKELKEKEFNGIIKSMVGVITILEKCLLYACFHFSTSNMLETPVGRTHYKLKDILKIYTI